MKCLADNMGIIDTERFISILMSDNFDYTEWQRNFYDSMEPGEIHRKAVEYAKLHPYDGKAVKL